MRAGWLRRGVKEYSLAASVYVVVEVRHEEDWGVELLVRRDMGAYVDPQHGMVIFRGASPDYCSTCPLRQTCVRRVKELSRKYNVKLRAMEPSAAYLEIFSELVTREFIKAIRDKTIVLEHINEGLLRTKSIM